MPKLTKNVIEPALRAEVFKKLNLQDFDRINDRTFGIILTDGNGTERYIRVNAVVTEEREDMTARELMQKEKNDYAEQVAKKAEKKAAAKAKAEADKARREKEKKGA